MQAEGFPTGQHQLEGCGARKKLAAAEKDLGAAEAVVKKANEALQSARIKRVEVQESLADLESKQKQIASQIAQRPVEPKTKDLDAASDSIKALWEAGGNPTSVNAAIEAVLRRSHRLVWKCLAML